MSFCPGTYGHTELPALGRTCFVRVQCLVDHGGQLHDIMGIRGRGVSRTWTSTVLLKAARIGGTDEHTKESSDLHRRAEGKEVRARPGAAQASSPARKAPGSFLVQAASWGSDERPF